MEKTIIGDCMRMSFADTPFPEVVGRLAAAGVRAYRADLVRLQSAYYGDGDDSYDHVLPLRESPVIADDFDEPNVVAAIRAIQRGDIGYVDFLRRIMSAGCASYSVFIEGRKAMYFGRDGAFYTEKFPGAK